MLSAGFLKGAEVKWKHMLTGKRIVNFGPTRGFLLVLSIGLSAWGLFMLNPLLDTFAANPTLYRNLAAIASESAWGAIWLVAGLVMGYGVWVRNLTIISMGSMFGFLLWTCLALCYGLTSVALSPIVSTTSLALLHAHAWLAVKLFPTVITNKHIWNDDEVTALAELAEHRKQQLIQEVWRKESS